MDRRKSLIYPVVFLGAVAQNLGKPDGVNAQVMSDGSLATPTAVLTFGSDSTISGGTAFNSNLFHSFSQFSIIPGGRATFNIAPNIEVIFARVTGGNPSSIRGAIVVPGAADLFLMNPAGVEFSDGAVLNLGGSLFVTSAERLDFAEGGSFSAAAGALNAPLLNVNLPSGLQWGAQAGGISVANPTGNYGGGQDVQLLGGPVMLNNLQWSLGSRNFSAGAVGPNSQVSLVSSNGTAQLDRLTANYSAVTAFEDITLSNGTTLDSVSPNPGDFRFQGRRLDFLNGSRLSSETSGAGASGEITLNAANALSLQGFSGLGEVAQVTVGTSTNTPGMGGRLSINAPMVTLADGAQILADNGGTISLTSNQLALLDGGRIDLSPRGAGDGGSLTLSAQDVLIQGTGPTAGSGIVSLVENAQGGNGGDINLTTNRLRLLAGGVILAGADPAVTGGDLTIQATDLRVDGSGQAGNGQTSISRILNQATLGTSGAVAITATDLTVTGGGLIASYLQGAGTAGPLRVTGDRITLAGDGQSVSRIAALDLSGSGGTIGDLAITASASLELVNGGSISSQASGTTTAGPLSISAADLLVRGQGGPSQNQLQSQITTSATSGAQGSDLTVTAGSLSLDGGVIQSQLDGATGGNVELAIAHGIAIANGAEIKAELANNANGGNLTITTAGDITASGNSDLYTSVNGSQGGNIAVTANALVNLEARTALTSQNDLVAGGNLALLLTAPPPEPPVVPPVVPPVDPPVTPPVEPPVTPPAILPQSPPSEMPVVPPVEPPLVPPSLEPTPPSDRAIPGAASLVAWEQQVIAGMQARPESRASEGHGDAQAALQNAAAREAAELAPGCTPGTLGTPATKDRFRVQPEAPQAEWSATALVTPLATAPVTEAQGWAVSDSGQVQLLAGNSLPMRAVDCGWS